MSLQMLRSLVPVTPDNDAELTLTLNSVISEFKIATRRKWVYGSYIEEIRPDFECDVLFVDGYPIQTISVSERASKSDSWTPLTVDVDYVYDPKGLIENIRDAAWLKYVKIDYTGGYADDAAPPDVLLALALEVRRSMARNQDSRVVLDSQLISDNGTTKYLDLAQRHPAFLRAVNRYKRWGLN